ncbi:MULTISPECIES: hypothetical protein [Acetobacter]|uniref:Uncharacterized protein n=1 Tax=Acetobacter pasteurianus subsp. pasteurianus TaxID=481145 RepID=A0A1Y0Y250_ACEPA|nr:hypothetical protein [Acetobacter pasteurianus]AKR48211.1 hypothetical protein DB34_04115 [Acetobacter pasteurianus]ARW47561.1 hypothetical protein S1001342_01229 [Acetobacter pasteurianus subsp. pasteurianus]
MTKYVIVAAKPNNDESHLNSKFKVWEQTPSQGWKYSWKSIHDISDLIRNGHEVLTGELVENKPGSEYAYTMKYGEKVEMVLRIIGKDKKYKISEMPDK